MAATAAVQYLPAIRRALIEEILRQLGLAQADIEDSLRTASTAEALRRLSAQRTEIARVMEVFRAAAAAASTSSTDAVWQGGIDSISEQLGEALAPRIDTRSLLAVRTFLTDKIADISRDAVARINAAMTQHLTGARSLSDVVTDIQNILGIERRRAMTIAYTEVGRAYSVSQYETMLDQAKKVPGLRKRWIHSGKSHPRPGHVLIAAETKKNPIPVDQPFNIVDLRTGEIEQLQFPRDPNASAFNTVNCGCMMVAVPPSLAELFPASRK